MTTKFINLPSARAFANVWGMRLPPPLARVLYVTNITQIGKKTEKRKNKLRDADYLSQGKNNDLETCNSTTEKKEVWSIIIYTCRKYRSVWRIVTTMNISTSAYLNRVTETKNSYIWKIMIVINKQFLFNKIKSVS